MPDFDVLMFTDCRAGEGLLGREGLQFRTASAGAGPAPMAVVERHCLYEPPDEWLRRRRPVTSFPGSLAHIADGQFATAAGIYLGTEAKGSRQGNHFTHALVATDPDAYGQVRPAQLWESSIWRSRWDGSTTCPAVPADPPMGPLDPLTLRRWVAGHAEGRRMLVAVLSALHTALDGGRRVMFVSSDPEPVLRWLATATVLMPRSIALQVGFKVYVTNPDYSAHEAVAVHPDWAPAYRGAPNGTSFTVFDLDSGARSEAADTDAARFWVEHFLTGDCFDVLDAVEMSGTLAARAETSGGSVERAVAAALVLGEPIGGDATREVTAWLDAAVTRLPGALVADVVALLLDAPVDRAGMAVLQRAAARARDSAHLTHRVLARTATLITGRAVSAPRTAAEATVVLEQLLVHAGATEVPELLGLAGQYELRPRPSAFPDALNAFVRWWADNPADFPAFDTWPTRDTIVDLLRDQLASRVRTAAGPEAVAAVGDRWWPLLLGTLQDPIAPLDAAVAAATMRSGTEEQRRRVVSQVLWALGPDPGGRAVSAAWNALYRDRPPAVTELPGLLALAAAGPVPAEVVNGVEHVLSRTADPGAAELAVLDRLTELGWTTTRDPLARWQQQALALRSAAGRIAAIPADAEVDEPVMEEIAAAIALAPAGLVLGRSSELVDAMRHPAPQATAALVRAVPQPQRGSLLTALSAELAAGLDDRIAAACHMIVSTLDRLPLSLWKSLAEQRRRRSTDEVHRVARLLDDDEREHWWALDPTRPPKRGLNPFRRPR